MQFGQTQGSTLFFAVQNIAFCGVKYCFLRRNSVNWLSRLAKSVGEFLPDWANSVGLGQLAKSVGGFCV